MIERQCPVCEKVYMADPGRLKYGRQTTCSRQCSYDLRAQTLNKSTTLPCAVCGTPVTKCFDTSQGVGKAGVPFCSPACHYKARGMGIVKRVVVDPYDIPQDVRDRNSKLQTERNLKRKDEGRYYPCSEETKQKLSITTSKAIADGRIPRVSKLEKDVGIVLEQLGIDALAQHGLRGSDGRYSACLDFYIPSINTALEINGTFWHCDPRVYPEGPKHFSQKRNATKYAQKRIVLDQFGINLVEVWEADFQLDPVGSVKAALGL